jgi:hypothetical protein
VDQQYTSFGLSFSGAAVTQINGVNVWTPASYSSGSTNPSLNYAPGSSFFIGFVDPTSQNAASTNLVSVEFLGVPAGRGLMTVYDNSPNGTATLIDTDVGPHGGGLVTFQESGILGVSLSRSFAGQNDYDTATSQPWGVAQIQIGDLTLLPTIGVGDPIPLEAGAGHVHASPEPSSVILASFGGLLVLASCRRPPSWASC